jgi:hypothetical protein
MGQTFFELQAASFKWQEKAVALVLEACGLQLAAGLN